MPYTALVLSDFTDTARTFDAVGLNGNVMSYAYQPAGGSLDSRWMISLSVTPAAKNSQVHRVKAKVVIPVMDTVDPAIKVGETVANVEFLLPRKGLKAQRQHLRVILGNLIKNTPALEAIQDVVAVY